MAMPMFATDYIIVIALMLACMVVVLALGGAWWLITRSWAQRDIRRIAMEAEAYRRIAELYDGKTWEFEARAGIIAPLKGSKKRE